MFIRNVSTLLLCAVIASCANTSLMDSWNDETRLGPYKHLMIIGVSDSQQTRQVYEKYFVAELKKKNITATPSYKLISSKQKINRETIVNAIQETDIAIDSVLLTYIISADAEMKPRHSPLNIGYSGNVDDHRISDTIVSKRGVSRSSEVYVLKNDLYDVQSRTLVWSAQTKTVGPESVDEVIEDVTELLIKEMISDGILQ
jgi:hypothetical protein